MVNVSHSWSRETARTKSRSRAYLSSISISAAVPCCLIISSGSVVKSIRLNGLNIIARAKSVVKVVVDVRGLRERRGFTVVDAKWQHQWKFLAARLQCIVHEVNDVL